jgi:Fe-S cluster assembly protein SufD
MKTRGIDAEEAQTLLSYGFINEVVNTIRIDALRDFLRPLLASRFATDPRQMRHLV